MREGNEADGPILVIGAGALGSFLAARLALGGFAVAVVARGARLAALSDHGIRLKMNGVATSVAVKCAETAADLPPPRLAILATKTPDLEAAAAQLRPFATPSLGVLTVQNGVEAPERVAHLLSGVQVIASRVHGFFQIDEGIIRHVGVEPSIAFGPMDGGPSTASDLLGDCLTRAGIAFSRPPDMARIVWEKFLLASAIGGVGAALGVTAGQLQNDPDHWAMLSGAMEEIALLARTRGIGLPENCVTATLEFVASFPPGATSSLQRDLAEKRPSEFDQLTGAVLRLAEQAGLDLPVHREIARMIAAKGHIRPDETAWAEPVRDPRLDALSNRD